MTRADLSHLMEAFECVVNVSMTGSKRTNEDFVDNVFRNFDVADEGLIEYDEFRLAASAHPQLAECLMVRAEDDEFSKEVGAREILSPEEQLAAEALASGKGGGGRMCDDVSCRIS
jgi:Ca2+-binding EF-hand superfamily protein